MAIGANMASMLRVLVDLWRGRMAAWRTYHGADLRLGVLVAEQDWRLGGLIPSKIGVLADLSRARLASWLTYREQDWRLG